MLKDKREVSAFNFSSTNLYQFVGNTSLFSFITRLELLLFPADTSLLLDRGLVVSPFLHMEQGFNFRFSDIESTFHYITVNVD